jgi:tRNA (cmo5U34)-methyltransferase
MSFFTEPDAVASYAEGPVRLVPGFRDLQRMAAILLAERLTDDARLLVLGAGGGLELKAFADVQPGWQFVGVDPSADMLALALQTIGSHAARVQLHHGYIDTAPDGPYDAATCLLTLHFVARDARLQTLTDLRKRLKPGAPLVVAHHSFPQGDKDKALWLSRYAAFAVAGGVPADKARHAADEIGRRLPIMSPEQEEALLRDSGFTGVALF